jgi:DNA-binding CsgD family transcriptional regulator
MGSLAPRDGVERLMAGVRGSFDWARHTAHLIGSIGGEDLAVRALAALCELVAFEHTGVFLFRRQRRPRDLLARRTGDTFHRTYFDGTYELDPFYKGAQQQPRSGGVYRMPDLDPSYRRYLARYEMGPRLADVLPQASGHDARGGNGSGRLAEEIGFLLPVGAGRVVHIALIRSTALAPFSDDEVARLRELAPVLQAAFDAHFRWLPNAGDGVLDDEPAMARRCPAEIAARLTSREIEVVEHMLVGLATGQIASRMEIAEGTVKVHRKNVYRKLAVCARDELLSLCLAPRRDARR